MRKSYTFLPLFKSASLFFILLLTFLLPAQNSTIDSLEHLLSKAPEDTSKIKLYEEITAYYIHKRNNFNEVKEYGTKQLALALKLNHKPGIAHAYIAYGIYYKGQSNYKLSLKYLFKALALFQELNDNTGTGAAYFNIGGVYLTKGNYNIALEYLLKAKKIQETLKDKKTLKATYNNIAIVYNYTGKVQLAINYYFKALKINEELNDSIAMSSNYNNIGVVFSQQNKTDAAITYFLKALRIKEAMNDKRGIAAASNNLGDVYREKKKYGEALSYFLKSLKNSELTGNKEGIGTSHIKIGILFEQQNDIPIAFKYLSKGLAIMVQIDNKVGMQNGYNNLGIVYEKQKKYENAIDCYTKSLSLAKEIYYKEGIRDTYKNLSSVYAKTNNFKKAYEYINLFYAEKDSLLNKENFQQLTEINTRYETHKKEKEIQLLTKDQIINEKILKQQKIVRLALIFGLILLFSVLSLVYKRYRFKQKANLLLEVQKNEIQQQNALITDSIDYAKNIQEAILPNEKHVKRLLPESFILFKPKAVVSGDFYWVEEKNNKIICIAADCTGHGVPGAFMSLLGFNMLDNITTREVPVAANILNTLNSEIVATLSQPNIDKEFVKHGMDAAILIIDKTNMQAQYAGAHNSLYFIRNGQLNEIKADKIAIGSIRNIEQALFTNHTFRLEKGDAFYLFTDGFPDQIGETTKKKLYYKPFKELLSTIHTKEMEEQKNILDQTITAWRGKRDQTDDILVIGIRI